MKGPIAQLAEHPADNGEVSRSSRLRPTSLPWWTAWAIMLIRSFRVVKQACATYIWGCSSVGRASVLHTEGQRFDSAHLHQYVYVAYKNVHELSRCDGVFLQ